MGAHIHQGKQGQNGPVVARLFNPNMSSRPTGDITSSLVKGANIMSSDLQCPLVGKQMPDLITLLKKREAYVNIHTEKSKMEN
jgi:CHRD domain